ncbi:MAG: hypothetical protein ABIG44_06610 [Planctomycetota bacterium]
MDAEKRHQLKTNELAQALSKIKDFGGDSTMRYWLLAIVVVIVAFLAYRMWGSMHSAQLAAGWQSLSEINTLPGSELAAAVENLRNVATGTTDKALIASARIRLGAVLRRQAETQSDNRQSLLAESATVLQQAVDDPDTPAPLAATAAFSLATTCESLSHYEPDRLNQAQELYRQLVDEPRYAGTPFTIMAEGRLENFADLHEKIDFLPGAPPPVGADAPSSEPLPVTSAPATQPAATPATTPISAPLPDPPASQPAPSTPGDETP